MRKLMITAFLLVFVLSGCLPNIDQEDEVVQENENTEEKAIVPKFQISESYYRTLTPFKPSGVRGAVVSNLRTRYDSDEMEEGLMRIALKSFPTNKYIFQEGQYLDGVAEKGEQNEEESIKDWLKRSSEHPSGLNPPLAEDTVEDHEANPIYLSHILEHNYLLMTDDNTVKLGGITIGLALNSVYRYRTRDNEGLYYSHEFPIPEEDVEKEGKRIAETIITRLRQTEGLESIPITIALFKQTDIDSFVPGNYFAYGTSKTGSNLDWNAVNEKYVLFPSNDAGTNHHDDSILFGRFQDRVNEYFPEFNGIVGKGLYINDELNILTIEINMEFNGKAEVIGFTQYVAGLLTELFPQITAEIKVMSVSGQEALIFKEPDMNEPFVHIY